MPRSVLTIAFLLVFFVPAKADTTQAAIDACKADAECRFQVLVTYGQYEA